MIIVWRGLGIIVLPIFALAMFAAIYLNDNAGLKATPNGAIAYAVAGLIAGACIWFIARKIESKPGRVFIDKSTGREINIRPSAGSFFFVPTRYWAHISVAVGLAICICILTGKIPG